MNKKEIRSLKKILKNGTLNEQKEFLKDYIDICGGRFNTLIPLNNYSLVNYLPGVIIEKSSFWKELIFYCIDTLGMDPYAPTDSSGVYYVVHNIIRRKGVGAVDFINEWNARGLDVNKQLSKTTPISTLGLVLERYAASDSTTKIVEKLLSLGADVNFVHQKMRLGNDYSQWVHDTKSPEEVWAMALRSNNADCVRRIVPIEVYKNEEMLIYENGGFSLKKIPVTMFLANEMRATRHRHSEFQAYLWKSVFPEMNDFQKDTVLRVTSKSINSGDAPEATEEMFKRSRELDGLGREIRANIVNAFDHKIQRFMDRYELAFVKKLISEIMHNGGIKEYLGKDGERGHADKALAAQANVFANFLHLEGLKDKFLDIADYMMDGPKVSGAMILAWAKINSSASSLHSNNITVFKSSASFWVNKLIDEMGRSEAKEWISNKFFKMIVGGSSGEYRSDIIVSWRYLLDAMVSDNLIDCKDVHKELEEAIKVDEASEEYRKPSAINISKKYLIEMERKVLLKETINTGSSKKTMAL